MKKRPLESSIRSNRNKALEYDPKDIKALFHQIETIKLLITDLRPLLTKLFELFATEQIKTKQNSIEENLSLVSRLDEFTAIIKDTQESSNFVKRIFTQEKPKKTNIKIPKSEAIDQFLLKYNKSMKL